jgi:vacuolar-type H+-ATPase subunit F/Vma7
MIKMTGKNAKTGTPFVLLGITDMNIKQMNMGKPIHVLGSEMGVDVDIVIITGKDEDTLAETLRPFVSETMRVTDRRDRKRN